MAYFELRQYGLRPGKRAEMVKYMDEVVFPHLVSSGVIAVGSFASEQEEEAVYVWIWRYESEEEKKRLGAAFNDDYWNDEIIPTLKELMDFEKMDITRLVATPKSILR